MKDENTHVVHIFITKFDWALCAFWLGICRREWGRQNHFILRKCWFVPKYASAKWMNHKTDYVGHERYPHLRRYSRPLRARWIPKASHILPSWSCVQILYTLMTSVHVSAKCGHKWSYSVAHPVSQTVNNCFSIMPTIVQNAIPARRGQERSQPGTVRKVGHLLLLRAYIKLYPLLIVGPLSPWPQI